jgi:hypothetical protein
MPPVHADEGDRAVAGVSGRMGERAGETRAEIKRFLADDKR